MTLEQNYAARVAKLRDRYCGASFKLRWHLILWSFTSLRAR